MSKFAKDFRHTKDLLRQVIKIAAMDCHESQSSLEIAVSPQVTNINCRKSLVLRCHNYKLTNISPLASVECVAKAGQGGRKK